MLDIRILANLSRRAEQNRTMVLGSETDYLSGYKRNSVTEWLQKTGQAENDGNFLDATCMFAAFTLNNSRLQ